MQRRRFLKLIGVASAGGITASAYTQTSTDTQIVGSARAEAGSDCSHSNVIKKLEFTNGGSLLDASGGELTDSSVIAVWAEQTAENTNGSVTYSEDTPIPLVANDGGVWGFGALMVQNDLGMDGGVRNEYGNEELVLNTWDAEMGGSGTVLWDEGHNNKFLLSDVDEFHGYVENNGYTLTATTDIENDLSNADGVVIDAPESSFSSSELTALSDFVGNGGAVFLHDQSSESGGSEATNLNEIANELSLAFRFNDDHIDDPDQQDDAYKPAEPQPVIDEFNVDNFSVFDEREGLGLNAGTRYSGTVTDVTDGDTIDVEVDATGKEYELRILGMDTPETSGRNCGYEDSRNWEWIEDESALCDWGDVASDEAKAKLDGENVEIELDKYSDPWDPFGRLLAFVHFDNDGDGTIDTNWSVYITKEGLARCYDAGSSRHEKILDAEYDARQNDRNVWQESDGSASEVRDRSVSEVFQPYTSSIRTSDGAISSSRVPLFAESDATQDLDAHDGDTVDYGSGDIPLVGVDEANNIAMVGGPSIDESYHSDVDDMEHETFLTNLFDYLKADSRDGMTLVDGGHNQFKEPYALSVEGIAPYKRYLEGQGILTEQSNDLTQTDETSLGNARTLIISSPKKCFNTDEVDAVSNFISNGGSVILIGSGWATPTERDNLNDLANALGSDLRLNNDQVVDSTNNVGDPELLYTTNKNTSDFSLWSAYS